MANGNRFASPLPTATYAATVQAGLRTLEWAYPAESPSRARAQWLYDSTSLDFAQLPLRGQCRNDLVGFTGFPFHSLAPLPHEHLNAEALWRQEPSAVKRQPLPIMAWTPLPLHGIECAKVEVLSSHLNK